MSGLQNFRVETERLILRLFTPEDAPDFHEIVKREEVTRNVNMQPESLDEVRASLRTLIGKYRLNAPEKLVKLSTAVVWKETNRVIGWAGLAPMEIDPADIEIYYGVHPDYWGKGIAAEAASALLDFGFRTLKLCRIAAITLPENHASARVLEKIGMLYRWRICDLPKRFKYFEGCRYFSLSLDDYLKSIN